MDDKSANKQPDDNPLEKHLTPQTEWHQPGVLEDQPPSVTTSTEGRWQLSATRSKPTQTATKNSEVRDIVAEKPPTTLGQYHILAKLGQGSMGIVYKANDPANHRYVALKTIHKNLSNRLNTTILKRFQREAEITKLLSHPNIVQVYEYGEDKGIAFIAMEYLAGDELKQLLNNKIKLDLHQIAQIMLHIFDGLSYMHNSNVVHRDLKPSNIFVLENGNLKLTDFGVAHQESSDLTQVGTVIGTPGYMPPEQLYGGRVDHRADLYSAGIILYYCLTGVRPFTGSFQKIKNSVLHTKPLPVSQVNPLIPQTFDAMVARAIATNTMDRFQSAAEFATALNACMDAIK